jgi:hypothetical protein
MRALSLTIVTLCLAGCAAQRGEPFLTFAQIVGTANPACVDKRMSSGPQRAGGQPSCNNVAPVAELNKKEAALRAGRASPTTPYGSTSGPDETEASTSRVPTLNVEASCHVAVDLAIDHDVNRCLVDETGARDQLVRRWTEFAASDRSQCVRYSSWNGGTYTELLTCLEMSRLAGALHTKSGALARQ